MCGLLVQVNEPLSSEPCYCCSSVLFVDAHARLMRFLHTAVFILQLGLSKSVGQIEQALSTSGHHTHISAGHTDAVSAHEKRFKHKAMRLLSICQKQEKTIAAMLLTFHHCLSDRVFAIACLHVRDIIGAAHVTYYTVGSACVPTSTSEASTHGSTHGLNAVSLSSQHPVAAAAVSGLPVNHADGRVGSSASSVSPTKRLTASQAGQVGCITVPVCSRAGKSYVLGVIEATCQPGKSFTADDERLVGAVASQLAFVIERREASSSVETLAKTGTRSTAEWRAMLAEKSAIIEDLQTRLDRATLAPSSSTESRVDRRELNELRSRYEEQTATLERLEKKLMESGRSELVCFMMLSAHECKLRVHAVPHTMVFHEPTFVTNCDHGWSIRTPVDLLQVFLAIWPIF